jgi:hypothetical protein
MCEDYGETHDNRHHLADNDMNNILIKLTAATTCYTLQHNHKHSYSYLSKASRLGFMQYNLSTTVHLSNIPLNITALPNTDTSTAKSPERPISNDVRAANYA